MFNPYHARPIGTEKFENHLLTLMVEGFETQQAAKEALPEYPVIPRAAAQDRPNGDPIDQCWKDLDTAVLSLAVLDYLDAYEMEIQYRDRHDAKEWVWFSRCAVLENEYFRQDEEKSEVLDRILEVIHEQNYLKDKIRAIRKMRQRVSMQAGWSGRGRTA